MLCALINENYVVTELKDIPEDQLQTYMEQWPIVVDVENIIPQPEVGWLYDGVNFQGTPTSMKITKLALRQRITVPEMIGLYTAMNTNPVVKILFDNLMAASYIDLMRADTQQGVMYLVSQGLLTMPRATAILTTPPTASEKYRGII